MIDKNEFFLDIPAWKYGIYEHIIHPKVDVNIKMKEPVSFHPKF